ncbi:site-specific integrase [Halocynthiibacter sp.]|uniref:site-specific integrase n=1 Tax=Halocynthiibacter sp. TaxID=1979210 RepID=UPI003C4AD819
MATFKKLTSGKWQAQIARAGVRRAKSFPTKSAAKDWAARQEYQISEGTDRQVASGRLWDLFDRYAREVSPKRKGARWEIVRLERLKGEDIAKNSLAELSPLIFSKWRDMRLGEVSPGSVIREMNLMSAVLTVARKEWGLISVNPLSDVRKPAKPRPRDRLLKPGELDKLLEQAGFDLSRQIGRAVHAFRFAIETGMRAGEILSLTSELVDLEKRVATLTDTKNGTARKVPLSNAAVELLKLLPDAPTYFDLSSANLDALFRRARDNAKIEGLRFHDSRHEAVTRLSRKLDVLSLARMIGHKDIKMLQVYYNESAEDIAKRLD